MSDSEIEGPAPAETACDSLHLWHQAVATLAAVVLVLCAARLADRKRVGDGGDADGSGGGGGLRCVCVSACVV